LKKNACKLVLFGEGAEQIGAACAGCSDLHYVQDLLGAVHAAHALAEPGDLVLLSPACASFDMFSNYEERGDVFRKAVNDLINAAPSIGVER
jgi:UDP-N-acetylmuramoylalanine--D-glutamate ligase